MGDRTPGEIKTTDSKDYYIRAGWEARAETPDELAARFLRMIDALKKIDPVFSLWTCGGMRSLDFEKIRDRYAEEIAAGLSRSDWGEPTPVYGYWFAATTRDVPRERYFVVRCHAGGTVKESFPNSIILETSSLANLKPDPSVVSYRVFRPALLAIVDVWNPAHAGAYSQQLIEKYGGDSYFSAAWIQYLSPWLAEKITPPSTVLAEHLPNGGLLMSATTETFDIDNPAHLAAAQDMAAAMAPLNALPWPSQK
ncbi:MAG: Imm52 family immunity protein [Methylocystis sp.]